jgi:hypothetical protein
MFRHGLVQEIMSQILGTGGAAVLNLLQTGTIDLNGVTSNTATVTSVVTGNSSLTTSFNTRLDAAGNEDNGDWTMTFTNATTITVARYATGGFATAFPVRYWLTEYIANILKSTQNYSIDLSNVTSATATISAVTTAKTLLNFLGKRINVAAQKTNDVTNVLHTLTNTTTVTASRGASTADAMLTTGEAVEFL